MRHSQMEEKEAGSAAAEQVGGRHVQAVQQAEKEGREEEVEVRVTIEWLQDEVLCIIFSNLDTKTLVVIIPQVCKLWRAVCQDVEGVHLDFSWWREKDEYGGQLARLVYKQCASAPPCLH